MTNLPEVLRLSDGHLAAQAYDAGQQARRAIARIASPTDGAKFVHDSKAIRDRIHKLRIDKEQAFEAAFPWDMAWLEGMRHTGGLIERGQEAGTIARQQSGRPDKSNSLLHIRDLEIEPIESSRWQRLAQIDDEDWRAFEEANYEARKLPTLTGALGMFGSDDKERPWLRVYQVWNFPFPDPNYGQSHPGMIPAQVMMNLNYYYTDPGDLIVDLFAGGGSTIDVCKASNEDFGQRKCIAYDIAPARTDIKKWDATSGLPNFPHARLLFLDPPYWKQKKGSYGDDETNFANMPLARFNAELEAVIRASLEQAELVALIIGPTQEAWEMTDHAAEMMCRVGVPWKRIQVPYSTQQHGGAYVSKAKEQKQWLYLARDLMIWRGTAT